jgi:hypothetical protein
MQHLVVIAGNLRCDHPGGLGRKGKVEKAVGFGGVGELIVSTFVGGLVG